MDSKKSYLQITSGVLGVLVRILVVILAVIFIYRGAQTFYDYGYRIFTEEPMTTGEGREVEVAITANMSPSDIGEMFVEKGLIRDARLFVLQYYLSEYRSEVEPGVYTLSTSMTVEEMMAAMVPEETEEEAGAEE